MAYLDFLLPISKMAAWFPFPEQVSNGQSCNQTNDGSGNGRHVAAVPTYPLWSYQRINRRAVKTIYSDGAASALNYSGTFIVKEIFIAANWMGGADFGAEYRGLLSDNNVFGLLVGAPGTTRFYNNNFSTAGTYKYKKSGVSFPESDQQAPIGKFELVNFSLSSGWGLDGIQFLQDRANDLRKFAGCILEPMFFKSVLTDGENAAVNLYFDLKYGFFKQNGSRLRFPDQSLTGLPYARFEAIPIDKSKITVSHTYSDGGSFGVELSDTGTRAWEIEINCADFNHALSKAKTDVFDAFAEAAGETWEFDFLDKYGELHKNVKIKDYARTHPGHESWNQRVKFTLIKTP